MPLWPRWMTNLPLNDFKMKPAHHFRHEAMNTIFHIRFAEESADAAFIARDCFEIIDQHEARLSRY